MTTGSAKTERWVAVGRADDFSVGDIAPIRLGDSEAILCRTAAGFGAIARKCLHAGADLAGGVIDGANVVCPLHGWSYRAATGVHVNCAENRLACYAVRIDETGVVHVSLSPTPSRKSE